eukprot:2057170-Rhodomonas_salina.1
MVGGGRKGGRGRGIAWLITLVFSCSFIESTLPLHLISRVGTARIQTEENYHASTLAWTRTATKFDSESSKVSGVGRERERESVTCESNHEDKHFNPWLRQALIISAIQRDGFEGGGRSEEGGDIREEGNMRTSAGRGGREGGSQQHTTVTPSSQCAIFSCARAQQSPALTQRLDGPCSHKILAAHRAAGRRPGGGFQRWGWEDGCNGCEHRER